MLTGKNCIICEVPELKHQHDRYKPYLQLFKVY